MNPFKQLILGLILGFGVITQPLPGQESAYLFSYFKGNGEDGLHLAFSRDGLTWKPLKQDQSWLTPTIGGKLMRDPSIVRGPDGVFHMVWSSGWWDLGFGYASSPDLIHWSPQRLIGVNDHIPGAKNTWAPDLFYDATAKQYVILYATTIPGRFPETDSGGDHNHRLYWIKTSDFKTFTEPELAYNPGYNCIDGTIVSTPEQLVMIYKDERPEHKQLHLTTTRSLSVPWSEPGAPILQRDWVEGPTCLKVKDQWMLYFDCYKDGHYAAARSQDGIHWQEITEQLSMPDGIRHGTAFAVPETLLQSLLKIQ